MLGFRSGQLTHVLKVSSMANVCSGGQHLKENKELIPLFMVPTICPPGLLLWLSPFSISCNSRDPSSFPGSGKSPGAGNGNHSSILAWRIPWTGESGGLQSMGSQSWTQLSN